MKHINEWLENGLRGILGSLSPDRRIILVIAMFLVFGGLSIYMTFSSIYNFGKNKAEKMQIEQIESLRLQVEQQRDSINNLKSVE
ncbi:TraL conjugative transposon family protein [Dysgonomonas sp. HGC4]|nr:TraL conjugative transposon family protein [Dysgonomonas sp. HGC4]